MNYEPNCEIKLSFGNHCIRSWVDVDADVLQKYANNRKIWANLRDIFPHPYTLEDARLWINHAREENPTRSFAIANEDEIMGGIGLVFQDDIHRYSAELGYWLAESYWGRGIMTAAVAELTDFAFMNYPLIRIYAGPFNHNIASQRVLEKAGYRKEGLLRNNVIKDGQILHQVLYAKTKRRFHDHLPEALIIS